MGVIHCAKYIKIYRSLSLDALINIRTIHMSFQKNDLLICFLFIVVGVEVRNRLNSLEEVEKPVMLVGRVDRI